jgi:hypothetical protein
VQFNEPQVQLIVESNHVLAHEQNPFEHYPEHELTVPKETITPHKQDQVALEEIDKIQFESENDDVDSDNDYRTNEISREQLSVAYLADFFDGRITQSALLGYYRRSSFTGDTSEST